MIANAQSVKGWMSEIELSWLAEQARKCNVIIEVGSYLGRSTIALADNCPGVVHSIDPYSGPYYYDDGRLFMNFDDPTCAQFLDNLKHHISVGKVIPHRVKFVDFKLETPADLIFIDGDHRHKEFRKDVIKAFGLIKSDGTISGHDYGHPDWPGVKKVVDELIGSVSVLNSIWWRSL